MMALKPIVISALVVFSLAACSSQPKTHIVVPMASPPAWDQQSVDTSNYQVTYKKEDGQIQFKRMTKDVTVVGGEFDSVASLTIKAKEKAVLEASEEVNGVAIKNTTKINKVTATRQRTNDHGINDTPSEYHSADVRQNIQAQTVGYARVKSQSCVPKNQGKSLHLSCRFDIEIPEISQIRIQ